MDFATLIAQGRLVRDPDVYEANGGGKVVRFTIAVNRRIKKGEERTSFIPIATFGQTAELCSEFLQKGKEIHVEGVFETDSFVDKEGVKRTGFSCLADKITFGRSSSSEQAEDGEKEEVKTAAKANLSGRIVDERRAKLAKTFRKR